MNKCVRTLTVEAFHAELRAQGVSSREDLAFVCPICKTVQSARDLIAAGAGATFEDIEKFLAFSCVGRWTAAGPFEPGTEPGRGCDWTLGGLFALHELEVVTDDGETHPRFELASREAAEAHRVSRPRYMVASEGGAGIRDQKSGIGKGEG